MHLRVSLLDQYGARRRRGDCNKPPTLYITRTSFGPNNRLMQVDSQPAGAVPEDRAKPLYLMAAGLSHWVPGRRTCDHPPNHPPPCDVMSFWQRTITLIHCQACCCCAVDVVGGVFTLLAVNHLYVAFAAASLSVYDVTMTRRDCVCTLRHLTSSQGHEGSAGVRLGLKVAGYNQDLPNHVWPSFG